LGLKNEKKSVTKGVIAKNIKKKVCQKCIWINV